MIRNARPADGEACAMLWLDFGRSLSERMPDTFRVPRREGLAEWFEREIARRADDELRLVAEEGGHVVGLAHARFRPPSLPPEIALAVRSGSVLLDDLIVAPPSRGRGIGSALVESVALWGRDRGAEVFVLQSDAEGPARRFYERLGFTVVAAVYSKDLRPPR